MSIPAYKLYYIVPMMSLPNEEHLVGGSKNPDIIITMLKAHATVQAMRITKLPGAPTAIVETAKRRIESLKTAKIWVGIPGDGVAHINGERPENEYYKVVEV